MGRVKESQQGMERAQWGSGTIPSPVGAKGGVHTPNLERAAVAHHHLTRAVVLGEGCSQHMETQLEKSHKTNIPNLLSSHLPVSCWLNLLETKKS